MPEGGISVIIITAGRPLLLSDCLASLRAAGGPAEVIVGINGPDPAAAAAAAKFGDLARVVQLPHSCRGEARNALAAQASGRWLCFLDDDVVVPAGYLDRLASLIDGNPGAAVFGGGQLLHRGAGRFERAVYALLASPFGGGPFVPRFVPAEGTRAAGPEKFILCNLTLDGKFLSERSLAFEGHLSSAEENLLLGRMAAAGAGMILAEGLNLVHRRRAAPWPFAIQVFSSGRGRGQITAASPKGFCAFTLLPPAALLAVAVLALRSPQLAAVLGLAYLLVCAVSAAASRAGARSAPLVLALYPVLHAAYAAGWLSGLAEGLVERVSGGRPRRCRCAKIP